VRLNGGCAEPQRRQRGGNPFELRSLHQKPIFEPRQRQLLRRVLRRAIELTLSESTKTLRQVAEALPEGTGNHLRGKLVPTDFAKKVPHPCRIATVGILLAPP